MKSITLRLSYLKCSIDARSEFLSAKVSENNILEKRLTAANRGSKLKKCSFKTFYPIILTKFSTKKLLNGADYTKKPGRDTQ